MNSIVQYLAVGKGTVLWHIQVKINLQAARVGGSHFKTSCGGKSPNVDGGVVKIDNWTSVLRGETDAEESGVLLQQTNTAVPL